MGKTVKRPDRNGAHRMAFESNKSKIFATQDTCGICGRPVDFSIPWPDPMSACVDHIIPIAKGGHPSDIDNLQLAHMICNRDKSDKLGQRSAVVPKPGSVNNRDLPQARDWKTYKA